MPQPDASIVDNILKLPCEMPAVLAVGAYLKNALCLIQGDEVWISPENGSLDQPEAIDRFYSRAQKLLAAARIRPVAVAHDLHPDFPCSRWAMECGLPSVAIQHHHAHIAAVMAEHALAEPVLGLALDGFGLGGDDGMWGGELLSVDTKGFERFGHLYPLPQPGGDIAAREVWRMGAGALFAIGKKEEIATRYATFAGAKHLPAFIEKGVNAPLTSSCGRLFDAACGLLGVKLCAAFEGEAPMALEGFVTVPQVMSGGWVLSDDGILDLRPLLAALLNLSAEEGANLFHGTLAAALADWLVWASQKTNIVKVALAGGCFFNKILREALQKATMGSGLELLWPRQLSAGDMSIAVGQAYAAALQLNNER
ncbi:MAG: hydrogenase maturation protein HypF [Alphaproteobacteria bacterium]|jgi:hydrogenase maturation protein HypF|nr:hydrogenase maturation protein HypF [Alphaproteobacteria bacterium]